MNRILTAVVSGGIAWLLMMPVQAAPQQVKFHAVLSRGTCTLAAPTTVNLSTVASPTEAAGAVGRAWVFLAPQAFDITLTCTSGLSGAQTTPAVTVSNLVTMTTGSNDRKNMIFTAAGNDTGFGVVLSKTPNTPMTNGSSAALLSKATPYIDTGALSYPTTTVKVYSALACGDASDCAATSLQPGNISVKVSFDFVYH